MMIRIFKPLIFIFILSGCFGQSENNVVNNDSIDQPGQVNEDIESEEEEDEYSVNTETSPVNESEMKLFMEKFLPGTKVDSFFEARKKYQTVKVDTSLINFFYNDAMFMEKVIYEGMQKSHPDIVYSGDDSPAAAWRWINEFVPYLKTECLCSECESESYRYIPEFQKKAKATNGKLDDEFFELMFTYYGEYAFTYITMNYGNAGCDYCGYNTFGDGEHIKLFEKIIKLDKKSKFLHEHLSGVVSAMTGYLGRAFNHTKEDVLKEMDQFIALQDSTQFDISNLIDEREKIHNAGKDYIFECTFDDFEY